MKQRPVAIGVMTCEQVIIEEKTRNITPVNCFTKREVERFPSAPFPFVVLALLTDGVGEMSLEVSISRLDTMEEVYRRGRSFQFTSPLHEVRCIIRIQNCTFPVAGDYDIMLLAENEMVAQRKIRITEKGSPI